MDRLTIPDKQIEGMTRRTIIDSNAVKENAMTIYWRLKKYEDMMDILQERIESLKASPDYPHNFKGQMVEDLEWVINQLN